MESRPYRPGEHGRKRIRPSDYRERLVEKQRLQAQYALRERQLRNAVGRAARRPGRTGEMLISDLETRLDALVLRSGFARTIYQARQAVSHGHIRVDGRRVDKPSYRVRPGQVIEVSERSRRMLPFEEAAQGAFAETHPPYLAVELPELKATLLRQPERPEVPVVCDETKVVEYYAR